MKRGSSKIFGSLDTKWVPGPYEFQYWEFLQDRWSDVPRWKDFDLDVATKTALLDWIDISNSQYESSLQNDVFDLKAHFERDRAPNQNSLYTQIQNLVMEQRKTLQELRSEANPRNEYPNLSVQYSLAYKFGSLRMELVPLLKRILRLKIPLGQHLTHMISHSMRKSSDEL